MPQQSYLAQTHIYVVKAVLEINKLQDDEDIKKT
jgi:hypothetical protein